MLLSSDRLGLHRDEDRPVLSVPSDQVHVLLQMKIRFVQYRAHFFTIEASVEAPTTDFGRPSSPSSGERRNIFERVRAKGRTSRDRFVVAVSFFPFSCERASAKSVYVFRMNRVRMRIKMNDDNDNNKWLKEKFEQYFDNLKMKIFNETLYTRKEIFFLLRRNILSFLVIF